MEHVSREKGLCQPQAAVKIGLVWSSGWCIWDVEVVC